MVKIKNCSVCNASFSCNASNAEELCWCSQYPAIISPEPGGDCFCPECLKKRFHDTIDHLIKTKKTETLAAVVAKYSGKENLMEGIDYYLEKGFWVFTAWYHLKRGHCCESGCRHCPYKASTQ